MKLFVKIVLFFLLFYICELIYSQEKVENINATLKDNKIIITYDLVNLKFNQAAYISLYYSTDNGKTFKGPLKVISGDVGKSIEKGTRKKIIWDPMMEQVFFNPTEPIIFRIKADIETQKIKRKIFVTYFGNENTPFGISTGLLGKTGFYLSARGNQHFNKKPQYTYHNHLVQNYEFNQYYIITNNHIIPEYALSTGVNFQLGHDFIYSVGLGYFEKIYLQEIKNFDYLYNVQTGTSWVNNSEANRSGPIIETGITWLIVKKFMFSVSTYYDFKYINWTAGFGFYY